MKRLTLYGLILSLLLCFPSLSKGDIVNFKNYQVGKSAVFTKDFYTIEKNSLANQIKYTGQRYVSNPANIKGLWVLQAENGSTITDLSGKNHTITLRDANLKDINASNFSPVFARLSSLTFDSTHVWDVADSDDFTFIEPQAWSTVSLIIPVSVTNKCIFAKRSEVTGATQKEYMISFVSGKPYYQQFDDSTGTGIQTRYYNTSLSGDIGTVHTYSTTYSGVNVVTNMKIYRDGTQIDDASTASGYTAMENKSARLASYYLDAAGALGYQASARYMFFMVIAEKLTQPQITAINTILLRRAGVY